MPNCGGAVAGHDAEVRVQRLFPVPVGLLRLASGLAGRAAAIERLSGSLRVDTGRILDELGWAPPHGMKEGLEETAAWYKNRGNG